VHVGVTRSPTDAWVAQHLREATACGHVPTYLVRDNDATYGPHVAAIAAGSGIAVLRTPLQAPRANAMCERGLGSVRRACLDHLLIVSATHLRRVLTEYVTYFNRSRPQQGSDHRVPEPEACQRPACGATGTVVACPVLGGSHHVYRRAA